jgi:tetratricopeptide (TPR) repeat protein
MRKNYFCHSIFYFFLVSILFLNTACGGKNNYLERGYAKIKSGDTNGAIHDFSVSIYCYPDCMEAYFSRGILNADTGKFIGYIWDSDYTAVDSLKLEEVLKDFDRVIQLKPDYAEAYYNRGLARYKYLFQAEKDLVRESHRYAGNAPKSILDSIDTGIKDISDIVEDYTKAVRIKPRYPEAFFQRGIARISLSAVYYARSFAVVKAEFTDYEKIIREAIRDFTKAIEQKPDFAEAYFYRAEAIMNQFPASPRLNDEGNKMKDYYRESLRECIEDVSRAIDLKPDYARAYGERGRLEHLLGDETGANEDFYQEAVIKNK